MHVIDFATIISVAFFGSFGHCIGMCGGFVVAYSNLKIKKNTSFCTQTIYHLFYTAGRLSSYMLLGAFFGFFGKMFILSKNVQGFMFFVIGIFMVLLGFGLLGKISFLKFL